MASTERVDVIMFNELKEGAFVKLHPSKTRMSVFDLMRVFSGKKDKARSREWRKLKEYAEIQCEVIQYQFPGVREQYQPMITFRGALKLVMFMSGQFAASCRTSFVDLLMRYTEGDETLHAEIEMNKVSGAVVGFKRIASSIRVNEAHLQSVMPEVGYIYATISDAFPGLVKIGKTVDMKARLSNMNTACAPMPHRVVALCPTLDYDRDESEAHGFFGDRRYAGEFFSVTHEDIKAYFVSYLFPKYEDEMRAKIASLV